MSGRRRAPSAKPRFVRYLMPLAAGMAVFGIATAFASSLTVGSKTLAAGNAGVSSCNASAVVSYNTAYTATAPAGYKVTTTPLTTSAAGCSGMAYKVTLTGASNAALAERSGTLDASGNASGAGSPDFTSSSVSAALVTGVSVVITG